MADERGRRRPYRVVFTPAVQDAQDAQDATETRCGTIVAATEQAARIEAQAIARDGGTARVQYVEPDGSRTVIGTYLPPEA